MPRRHRPPRRLLPLLALLTLFDLGQAALAATRYTLPPMGEDLIGTMGRAVVRPGDTLLDIARRHDLGQDEILLANPGVDRWLPEPGSRVVLPTRYILPRAERRGLVLNLPEMRIYRYAPRRDDDPAVVETYPVSVGRMDWQTPLGLTKVVAKDRDPAWRPPASIREEAAARGETLPEYVAPGPDNPLGRFALRLGLPGYLIHGTNKPWGVGMRVSHGCVRLYPEHIERLFGEVAVGTPVRIVDQPVKAGWQLGVLYLEVHPPLDEESVDDDSLVHMAMDAVRAAIDDRPVQLDGGAIRQAVQRRAGYPVAISEPGSP